MKLMLGHKGHEDEVHDEFSLCDLPIAIGSANLVSVVILHFICY